MIDNAAAPQDSTTAAATATATATATVRRYAPPSQRNRVLSRRKSGDRFDRTNSNNNNNPFLGNEGGERNTQPASSRNISLLHGGSHEIVNPQHSHSHSQPHPGLISIHGCGRSVAAQFLTHRWAAAMNSYNDPSIDLSERPVMYSGSNASAWGHSRLSHQVDFMTELRRAVCSANASVDV